MTEQARASEQTETDKELFLTPKELGVSDKEFCAIMKVAEGLQDGTIVHARTTDQIGAVTAKGKKPFHMGHWRMRTTCGTVCCIGGWAGFDENNIRDRTVGWLPGSAKSKYRDLFYPPSAVWADVTPRHAAKAIINWAKTGDPKWNEVLAQGTESD